MKTQITTAIMTSALIAAASSVNAQSIQEAIDAQGHEAPTVGTEQVTGTYTNSIQDYLDARRVGVNNAPRVGGTTRAIEGVANAL